MTHRSLLTLAVLGVGLGAACTSEGDGEGVVAVRVEGDASVSRGIEAEAVADGWSITFQSYVVSIGKVAIADPSGSVGAQADQMWTVELAAGGAWVLSSFGGLRAQQWDHFSFVVAADSGATAIGMTPSEATQLAEQGVSVLVDGTASKGATQKHFRWGFSSRTRYASCEATVGGKNVAGVVVRPGGTETVALTVHGEHLFYDDLQSHQAQLRFDPFAQADANADGDVTLEELEAVRLVEISVGTYGTGSATGINTLGDFVSAQAQSVVHFRGNGGCVSTTLTQR